MTIDQLIDQTRDVLWALGFHKVVALIKGLRPSDFYEDHMLLGLSLLSVLVLFFLKAYRVLFLIMGIYMLWFAKVNFIPRDGGEIDLVKLVSFCIVCLTVGVIWVYVFFIRGD